MNIDIRDIPGFAEAVTALQSSPHTLEGLATADVVAIVLTAATPPILAAAFSDVADQVTEIPGMEKFADWLDNVSNHIRKATT